MRINETILIVLLLNMVSVLRAVFCCCGVVLHVSTTVIVEHCWFLICSMMLSSTFG